MEKHIIQLIENESGEIILEFPPDLIKGLGWVEGDEIEFLQEADNNAFKLVKKQPPSS